MSNLPGRYARTAVYRQTDYERPKYLFEVTCRFIGDAVAGRAAPRLLDVGGASGAFGHYLARHIDNSRVSCLDYDPELCAIGRARLPHIAFLHGDANDMHAFDSAAFDAVSMLGTLSVFDDFRPSLGECLRVCRPGGHVVVVAQFNDHPVDALIRYRYADASHDDDAWNTGYNLFSRQSLGDWLERRSDVHAFAFHPFELPFDLAPQDDPIRSWTEARPDGHRHLVNGLNLIINLQILDIEVSA